MTRPYIAALPEVFPHGFDLLPDEARQAVNMLIAERLDVVNGSSFALTVDGVDGRWRLWLSEASYKFLESWLVPDNPDEEIVALWWDKKLAPLYAALSDDSLRQKIRERFIDAALDHGHDLPEHMRMKLIEEGAL